MREENKAVAIKDQDCNTDRVGRTKKERVVLCIAIYFSDVTSPLQDHVSDQFVC